MLGFFGLILRALALFYWPRDSRGRRKAGRPLRGRLQPRIARPPARGGGPKKRLKETAFSPCRSKFYALGGKSEQRRAAHHLSDGPTGNRTASVTENNRLGQTAKVRVKTGGKSARSCLVKGDWNKPCALQCHVNQPLRAARPKHLLGWRVGSQSRVSNPRPRPMTRP